MNGTDAVADRSPRMSAMNVALLAFLWVTLALITILFTSYTNNLDEIKVALQFVLLPWGFVGVFILLAMGKTEPVPRRIWAPLACFFAVLILSTLQAEFRWRAWYIDGWYWSAIAPFVIVVTCIRTAKAFRIFLAAYVALGLLVVLFGLYHYFGGLDQLMDKLYPLGPPHAGRRLFDLIYTLKSNREMFSTVLNKSFYASYLLILVCAAMALALGMRSWWEIALGVITAILAGYSIFPTESLDSETGLVLALIIMALCGFYLCKRLAHEPRGIALSAVSGVLLLCACVLVWCHWPSMKGIQVASVNHGILWMAGLKIFLRSPVLGAGPGSYLIFAPQVLRSDYFEHGIANVNLYSFNFYIDLLCETGVLGCAAVVFLFCAIVLLAIRHICSRGRERSTLAPCQIGLVAGTVVAYCSIFFGPDARWTVCGVNLWTFLGLATSCSLIGLRRDTSAAEGVLEYSIGQTQGDGSVGAAGTDTNLSPGATDEGGNPQPPGHSADGSRRLIGVLGAVASTVLAAGLSIFGVSYFVSAYWNNEGIVSINYAILTSDQALRDSFYKKSIKEFNNAIEWWPGFITSYYKQAHAYSMLGQYDNALNAYDRLSQYAPGYSETWFNYGVVYRVLAQQAQTEAEKSKYYRKSLENFDKAQRMSDKLNVQQSAAQTYQIAVQQTPDITDEERKRWADRGFEILHHACTRKYILAEDIPAQKNLRETVVKQLWAAAQQAEKEKDEAARKRYLGWEADICGKLFDENHVRDPKIIERLVQSLKYLGRDAEAAKYEAMNSSEKPTTSSLSAEGSSGALSQAPSRQP